MRSEQRWFRDKRSVQSGATHRALHFGLSSSSEKVTGTFPDAADAAEMCTMALIERVPLFLRVPRFSREQQLINGPVSSLHFLSPPHTHNLPHQIKLEEDDDIMTSVVNSHFSEREIYFLSNYKPIR